MLYGEPISAFDTFDLEWCRKCEGRARNIWNACVGRLREEFGREPEDEEVRRLISERERKLIQADWLEFLLREWEDRTPAGVRSEIRRLHGSRSDGQ